MCVLQNYYDFTGYNLLILINKLLIWRWCIHCSHFVPYQILVTDYLKIGYQFEKQIKIIHLVENHKITMILQVIIYLYSYTQTFNVTMMYDCSHFVPNQILVIFFKKMITNRYCHENMIDYLVLNAWRFNLNRQQYVRHGRKIIKVKISD